MPACVSTGNNLVIVDNVHEVSRAVVGDTNKNSSLGTRCRSRVSVGTFSDMAKHQAAPGRVFKALMLEGDGLIDLARRSLLGVS